MPTTRVNIKPELLRWACDRAGDRGVKLREKFPQLMSWMDGSDRPTLRQLERFANAARVAVGYLFLPTPPEEKIPIPDLRTVGGQGVRRPSPDLLDVIALCQRRQDWYREYATHNGEEAKPFVGSITLETPAEEVAERMQRELEFGVEERRTARSYDDALRLFIERAEAAGVLVMVSGVVGSNTGRKLDPNEFRGFTLADPVAPLVFVNSVDADSAQMFTLAHELAHVWLGNSALSDAEMPTDATDKTEQWCNRVAAEFLVPRATLLGMDLQQPLNRIREFTGRFKVSRLVILRRLRDVGAIDAETFRLAYTLLNQPHRPPSVESTGGNFYNTFPRSASKRLIRALYSDTVEGNTLYRDALQLLGLSKADTLRELAKKVGAT